MPSPLLVLLSATTMIYQNGTIIAGAILAILSFIIYRIRIHPLAQHRGPVLARLSSWPNWYHAAKGDRHIWLLKLHSLYGPAVRFSPSSVSFNTLSATYSIYTSRDANVSKGDWYQCVKDSAGGFESTFTARDKTRHALKRRILAHAFSERALREYEPRIKQLAEKWLHCLSGASRPELSVDFAVWANYIIFDILGDLCYSKDFGLIHSDKDRYITTLLPRTTRSWYMLGYHPWTHFLRYLLFKTPLKTSLGRIVARNNSRFRDYCIASFVERIQKEKKKDGAESFRQDMFHHLIQGRDPETGEGFSKGDLGAESVLLMIAGTHTTSVALAATVFYLARDRNRLEKVTEEVRKTFPIIEDLNYRQLATLPYLRACINEALRLCPPTSGHLQRETLRGGAEVDGIWYPTGINLGVSAYVLQRNPHIWPRPDEYLPERWLKTDGAYDSTHQPGLLAFSSGPLGCPGKQLAYMEMFITVAMLLHRFDIVLDQQDAALRDYVIKDCYVGQAAGPHIVLETRPEPTNENMRSSHQDQPKLA